MSVPGKLVVCATPIGNLGDVSTRLAEALASADVVFAEDTRRSRVLLDALGLGVPLRSYFSGNERSRAIELDRLLVDGRTVALITDAGMPVVSDPGAGAIGAARDAGALVTVIPGPSAVTAALAVSGMDGDRFVFEGFLPRKGRERHVRLEALATEQRTIVLFVAPHRLIDDLSDLVSTLGEHRRVCVTRELTKMHEELQWATVGEALAHWTDRGAKGEYTIVIAGGEPPVHGVPEAVQMALRLMESGVSPSQAAREAALELGLPRRDVYDQLLRRHDDS